MRKIKVQCPAKINLNLKITGRRDDGFHNIESVMQTIGLYDYLTITVENSGTDEIFLTGNSTEIPYDKTNLVYKAIELYMSATGLKGYKISVDMEKNIPVSAGLAGGSTDAAGVIYGLNKIFDNRLGEFDLHQMCAKLGSDLNVCLKGGRIFATGRGEIIKQLPYEKFSLSLIKPKNLGISAKEAYCRFAEKISDNIDISDRENYVNDLEWAIIDKYPQLRYIKEKYPTSVMTGSGSVYFSTEECFNPENDYIVINNIESVENGVIVVE